MSKQAKRRQAWSQAQKKLNLADETIRKAKALGLNPKKLGDGSISIEFR